MSHYRPIRRQLVKVSLPALLVFAPVAWSCASPGDADRGTAVGPITARIINHGRSDVRVYASRDGMRSLLGVVVAGRTEDFTLPSDLLGGAGGVRLVTDPIGGGPSLATDPLLVGPGQVVEWTLRTAPSQSGVTIR